MTLRTHIAGMRWLLLLLHPLLHLSVLGGWWWFHIRHQPQYYAAPELLSVVHIGVYLLVVPLLIQRLTVFSAERMAGFALVAAVGGAVASVALACLWSALHPVALWPQLHDWSFFVVVPFVAPLLGIWTALRLLQPRGAAPSAMSLPR